MAAVGTAAHPSRLPGAIIDRIPVPRRITLWWGLLLLSLVAGAVETVYASFGDGPWAPLVVHLDYVMTASEVVSALLLHWIVVRATGFIEQRYAATASPA